MFFAGKLCIVVFAMFWRMNSNIVLLCANVQDVYFTESVSLIGVVTNLSIGAGSKFWYPLPYPDEYILPYAPHLDGRRFAMMPVSQALTVKVCNEKSETAYVGWRQRWKHWGDRGDADGYTHTAFIDMPFVRSFKKASYKAKLSELIGRLRKENAVPTELSLLLWCGSDNLSDAWFASNYQYWVRDIYF